MSELRHERGPYATDSLVTKSRIRIEEKPMKITAIRVIKLPPTMLKAQPSSILKSIEICLASFRIKLLFLTFIWSQMRHLTWEISYDRAISCDQVISYESYDRRPVYSSGQKVRLVTTYEIIVPCIAVKIPKGWRIFWRFLIKVLGTDTIIFT